MKYVLQGADVTNIYEVKEYSKEIEKKPEFLPTKVCKWKNIGIEFDADHIPYNSNGAPRITLSGLFIPNNKVNISEDEDVEVVSEIFRADLNQVIVHTGKVLSETDDKVTNAGRYQKALEEYVARIFEKYPKVKEHCDIYAPQDMFENIDKIKERVIDKPHTITYGPVGIGTLTYSSGSATFASGGVINSISL